MGYVTWTDEELKKAVEENVTIIGVIKQLGLTARGSNYTTIHKACRRLGLNTNHFTCSRKGARLTTRLPIEDYLKKALGGRSDKLKKRLYQEGLKQPICELCGQDENWRGHYMALRLDHINGDNTDNRLENLRIVCPNCDATLPTFCRGIPRQNLCSRCGEPKEKMQKYCTECKRTVRSEGNAKRRKNFPVQEMLELVRQKGFEAAGRYYGVTGKAIKKRLSTRGLLPPSKKT